MQNNNAIFTEQSTGSIEQPTSPEPMRMVPPLSLEEARREKIQRFVENPWAIIGGISIVIILIIIIAVAVNLWRDGHDYRITITNFNNIISAIPDNKRGEIEQAVYNIASANASDKSAEELSRQTAVIREGSFSDSYDADTLSHYSEFIVDVKGLEHSYRVTYGWSNNAGSNEEYYFLYHAHAACLKSSELIYPYFDCAAPEDVVGAEHITYIDNILPYSGYTERETPIYVGEVQYTTGEDPFLRVGVGACGNDNELEAGLDAFKKYIESYELNPEDYKYTLEDLCDGEAE